VIGRCPLRRKFELGCRASLWRVLTAIKGFVILEAALKTADLRLVCGLRLLTIRRVRLKYSPACSYPAMEKRFLKILDPDRNQNAHIIPLQKCLLVFVYTF